MFLALLSVTDAALVANVLRVLVVGFGGGS